MPICNHCGKEIFDAAKPCNWCGESNNNDIQVAAVMPNDNHLHSDNHNDIKHIWSIKEGAKWLKAWVILTIIGNIYMAVVNFSAGAEIDRAGVAFPTWVITITFIIQITKIGCVIAIAYFRKLGFFGYIGMAVVGIIHGSIVADTVAKVSGQSSIPTTHILGGVVLAICWILLLYTVIKPFWKHLK